MQTRTAPGPGRPGSQLPVRFCPYSRLDAAGVWAADGRAARRGRPGWWELTRTQRRRREPGTPGLGTHRIHAAGVLSAGSHRFKGTGTCPPKGAGRRPRPSGIREASEWRGRRAGAGNDALPLRTRRRLCLVAPGSGWRLRRPSLHVGREGRGRRPSGGAARGGGGRARAPGGRAAAGGDVARWTGDAEGGVLPEGRTEAP